MNTTFYCVPKSYDLMHYGVKGMKWGVRKVPQASILRRRQNSQMTEQQLAQRKAQRIATTKKAAKIGAAVAVTALAAYGAYKVRGKAVKSLSDKYLDYASGHGQRAIKLFNLGELAKDVSPTAARLYNNEAHKALGMADYYSNKAFNKSFTTREILGEIKANRRRY